MTLTKIQADQTAFTPSGTGATVRTIDSKLEDIVSPKDFGAVGNGTTDDTTSLQAAINAAEAIVGPRTGATDIEAAYAVVDLGGRKYSISNSLTISEAIVLQNGAIVASSTFPINNYCINIADTAERAVIQRVDIDGGLYSATRRGNGIKVNAPRVHISRVYVNHFPQFGIRVFTSASVTTQEVRIENCLVREWQYSEAGRSDFALRTAKGISIEVADCYVINTTVAQSLRPLYLIGSLHIIDGCHFYNGGLAAKTGTYSQEGTTVTINCVNHGVKVNDHVKNDYTMQSGTVTATDGHFLVQSVATDGNSFTVTNPTSTTNSGTVSFDLKPVTVEIDGTSTYANNNIFSGCYFDNGTFDIKGDFSQTITGCHFHRNSASQGDFFIQSFTSATNEAVTGLVVTGCKFAGSGSTPIAFTVNAGTTGTYAEDINKNLTWVGNYRVDGSTPWVHAKFGTNAYFLGNDLYLNTGGVGNFNLNARNSLVLHADHNNNSGFSESCVEIKTDGTSIFKFTTNGDLEPQNVNYTIPTTSISSNTITSTAHGLVTGQALFYVSNGTSLVTSAGTAADQAAFFVIKVDDNSFKLASSLDNANANTPLTISGAGNNSQVFRTSTARVGTYSKPLETVFTDNVSLKPVIQPPNIEGRLYYDAATNKLKFYNGSAWETITSS